VTAAAGDLGVQVVADSTGNVPKSDVQALGMAVVQMTVTYKGVSRDEDDIDTADLYRHMRETGEFPTTSQPTVASLVEAFETAVAAGRDVVGVFVSERMSGTIETARMARDQVLARHPDARIAIVDTGSNSMEEGFPAIAAARAAAAGGSLEECVAAAEHSIARTRWYFTPATLDHLRMGGRIGTARAWVGTLLQVKPVLTVANGATAPVRQVRTQRRALEAVADLAAEDLKAFGFVDGVVHHIDAEATATLLAEMLEERSGHRLRLQPLLAVTGVHVGPGSVGVVYQTRDALDSTPEGT
jgi:DegV family protein with EDD domain